MDYVRWLENKPPCIACQRIHSRKGEPTPCSTCIVDVPDEDVDVARVFLASRSCVVTYQLSERERISDIDIRAVKCAMDIYKVVDQQACYERVRKLFRLLLTG